MLSSFPFSHRRGFADRRRSEHGGGLVETAIVFPILMLILSAIIDFGLRLSNDHAMEDGIRDAARSAAVGDLGGDSTCTVSGTPPSTDTHELICLVKSRIGLEQADIRVKVDFGTGGNVEGEPILVCAEYPVESVTGLLPEVGSGELRARSVMRLESDSTVTAFAEPSYSGSWTGCTP